MAKALEQATMALNSGEVPVGCVIVHNAEQRIVAGGHNETNITSNATRHAGEACDCSDSRMSFSLTFNVYRVGCL
jgi:tRNA(Arg) A34 adenosine deaminase TadA